jgi:hypothetical protein
MYPERCPVDPMETAEAFVMRRMDPRDATVYEEHLARCHACSKVVETTRVFVKAMREACRQFVEDEKQKPQ